MLYDHRTMRITSVAAPIRPGSCLACEQSWLEKQIHCCKAVAVGGRQKLGDSRKCDVRRNEDMAAQRSARLLASIPHASTSREGLRSLSVSAVASLYRPAMKKLPRKGNPKLTPTWYGVPDRREPPTNWETSDIAAAHPLWQFFHNKDPMPLVDTRTQHGGEQSSYASTPDLHSAARRTCMARGGAQAEIIRPFASAVVYPHQGARRSPHSATRDATATH